MKEPTGDARSLPEGGRRLDLTIADAAALRAEYTRNLHKGGAFVATTERFEMREQVEVVLRLPFRDFELPLLAEVVLCLPPGVAPKGAEPGVAVQFVGDVEALRARLEPHLNAPSLGTAPVAPQPALDEPPDARDAVVPDRRDAAADLAAAQSVVLGSDAAPHDDESAVDELLDFGLSDDGVDPDLDGDLDLLGADDDVDLEAASPGRVDVGDSAPFDASGAAPEPPDPAGESHESALAYGEVSLSVVEPPPATQAPTPPLRETPQGPLPSRPPTAPRPAPEPPRSLPPLGQPRASEPVADPRPRRPTVSPYHEERRDAPREIARIPARVRTSGGAELVARTRDLSRSGALLTVEGAELPIGKRVTLILTHPTQGTELEIDGRVARHLPGEGTVPAVAIRFEPAMGQAAAITRFIEEVQDIEEKRRREGIRGPIEEMGVASLLQMFASCGPRGTVTLTCGTEEGTVAFDNGLLVLAKLGPVTGTKALARLLAWNDGEFEFRNHVDPGPREQPEMSLEAALLDGLRRLDEEKRLALPQLPPDACLNVDRERLTWVDSPLSKTEEAVLELATAGFTVRRILDVIPDSDAEIRSAMAALVERGVLVQRR